MSTPLVKTKRIIIAVATGAVLLVGMLAWGVGYRTSFGRAVRGISTVATRNNSDTPVRNVYLYLSDSRGAAITRRFDFIEPHQQVRAPVRTSDLHVQRVVFEQGQRTITYDKGGIATRGEVLDLVVDSGGRTVPVYGE